MLNLSLKQSVCVTFSFQHLYVLLTHQLLCRIFIIWMGFKNFLKLCIRHATDGSERKAPQLDMLLCFQRIWVTCPFSPHEGRYTVTFISEQYVPSICPETAAPELREWRVFAGTLYLSSAFYKQGTEHFKIKCLVFTAGVRIKLTFSLVLYSHRWVFIHLKRLWKSLKKEQHVTFKGKERFSCDLSLATEQNQTLLKHNTELIYQTHLSQVLAWSQLHPDPCALWNKSAPLFRMTLFADLTTSLHHQLDEN